MESILWPYKQECDYCPADVYYWWEIHKGQKVRLWYVKHIGPCEPEEQP